MKIDKIADPAPETCWSAEARGPPLRAREATPPARQITSSPRWRLRRQRRNYGTFAGIEIYLQSKFELSTSWFNKRNQNLRRLYEGEDPPRGRRVHQGTRNMFVAAPPGNAPATAGSWSGVITGSLAVGGCFQLQDAVTGAARGDEAANWYIGRNARGSRFVAPVRATPTAGRRLRF